MLYTIFIYNNIKITTNRDVKCIVVVFVILVCNLQDCSTSRTIPKPLTNQKTNHYLKEVGKEIQGLNKTVIKNITKEGKNNQTRFAKWEMLTTHTARRSFATNEFLAGTPTLTIMAITGHKTEKAFLRYIKLNSSDHARLLKAHWEERA